MYPPMGFEINSHSSSELQVSSVAVWQLVLAAKWAGSHIPSQSESRVQVVVQNVPTLLSPPAAAVSFAQINPALQSELNVHVSFVGDVAFA